MGICCCDMFDKNEIHNNQSRLRLLESKVQALYNTQNDHLFTYYLHYFEQHSYLQRILLEYRQVYEKTCDSSAYQFNNKQLEIEVDTLTQYLKDSQNPQSQLSKRIKADLQRIGQQAQAQPLPESREEYCMVKLQIQSFEIVQGISKIALIKTVRKQNQEIHAQQNIMIGRTRHEKIYRELIFPAVRGSKIKIVTDPTFSKLTIDVEDIMKNEAVCTVFKFQNGDEDFGFIALRMQFFTGSTLFNKMRKERMQVLQKQLKLCSLGAQGVNRLSSRSNTSSHVNTFVSDHVSEYQNQYHM